MEQFLVNSGKKPCAVKFIITTDGSEVPVYIVGYDPLNSNTLYFRSRFRLAGTEEIKLNCPQSPYRLKVMVWSEDDLPFQIASVKLLNLDIVPSQDPSIKFLETFSRICGRVRPGNYVAKDVPFQIQLRRRIYRDNGQEHTTPARIHADYPVIQVSKAKFDQCTIPERMAILLHEVSHNFINMDPDNEKESDINGRNIYRQLGYPEIEFLNAFGNIMQDTDDNYERMLNLMYT